jgi:hypothetical protein
MKKRLNIAKRAIIVAALAMWADGASGMDRDMIDETYGRELDQCLRRRPINIIGNEDGSLIIRGLTEEQEHSLIPSIVNGKPAIARLCAPGCEVILENPGWFYICDGITIQYGRDALDQEATCGIAFQPEVSRVVFQPGSRIAFQLRRANLMGRFESSGLILQDRSGEPWEIPLSGLTCQQLTVRSGNVVFYASGHSVEEMIVAELPAIEQQNARVAAQAESLCSLLCSLSMH